MIPNRLSISKYSGLFTCEAFLSKYVFMRFVLVTWWTHAFAIFQPSQKKSEKHFIDFLGNNSGTNVSALAT